MILLRKKQVHSVHVVKLRTTTVATKAAQQSPCLCSLFTFCPKEMREAELFKRITFYFLKERKRGATMRTIYHRQLKQTQSMRLSWENGRKDEGTQLFVMMKRLFSSRQFDAFVRGFGTFMIRFITHIGLKSTTLWIFFKPFFWLMRFSHWQSRYWTNLVIQPGIVLRSHSHPI